MKERDVSRRTRRQDRLIREHIHDPYNRRRKLPEPTRCPQCGAVYQDGRWAWSKAPVSEANEETCQACHRVNDQYPAGEVQLQGAFVVAHADEITRLARNAEQAENAEHPENRIMAIESRDEGMVITTTDIHLLHRIGHLLEETWQGDLTVHYDEEGYFSRVEWRRDS